MRPVALSGYGLIARMRQSRLGYWLLAPEGEGSPSGQDWAILLAWDCLFCSLHESFFREIFSVTVERFSVISLWGCVNNNKNKESKNFYEFEEYILQQNPLKTKLKTQSDKKAWNAMK